jgi:transcriptional regulator with XRE-family HTH domain
MTGWDVYEDGAAVGRRIRQARRELGLTQAELATRIGVSLAALDRFETGNGDASDKLDEIAGATGKSVSWYTTADHPDAGEAYETGLPAELRRRLAESNGRHSSSGAELDEDADGAGHSETSSQRPPAVPLDRAGERDAFEQQDEPQVALAVEHEPPEIARSPAQEAALVQRISQLETELREAEERTAQATARLERTETELGARSSELDMREAAVGEAKKHVDFRTTGLDARESELRFRSTQLDTRDAELAYRSAQLDTREAELRYRSARLDTREATVVNAESDLDRRRRALELESAAASVASGRPPREDVHLAVMPDQGYKLVARHGAVPRSGSTVDLDGVRYRVLRVQRSPFPGDDRQCAVLELLRQDDEHSRSYATE